MSGFKFGVPQFFSTVEEELKLTDGGDVTENQVRVELARRALQNQNSNGIENEATRAVNGMKEEFGNGVCTRIRVYNASGSKLTMRNDKTFTGRWGKYRLPETIEVGEWATGLHIKKSGSASGSFGIFSYNVESHPLVFVVGWGTPWSGSNHGSCYCMKTAEWSPLSWERVEEWCEKDPATGVDKCGKMQVNYNIDQGSSPILTCIIKHMDA